MKVTYFIKRNTLMARVRANGITQDKSTGINVSGEVFDMKARRFHKKSPNAFAHNGLLAELEASIYRDVMAHGSIKKGVTLPSSSTDVTLNSALDEYIHLLETDAIMSRRSNVKISPATKKHLLFVAGLFRKMDLEFNFTQVNASTPMAKAAYETFINRVKARVLADGRERITANTYLTVLKMIISFVCERHDINVDRLIKNLVVKVAAKEVSVIRHDQVEYVINNYEQIRSTCKGISQKSALDYWLTALVINPRRGDMLSLTKENLYTDANGSVWVKYRPNKTKNSSSVVVDVPIGPKLASLFNRNIAEFGRPLPAVADTNLTRYIKKIAKRLEIFQGDIQIYRKGKYENVPQWKTLTLHQMRASGMTDKLGSGMPEAVVKAFSGHTTDSKSFRRYINMQNEAKQTFADQYFNALGGKSLPPQTEASLG